MNAPLSKEQIALLMSENMSTRAAGIAGSVRPGLVSRLSDAVNGWMGRRAVLGELRGLSDRELTDIGLVRTDLGRVFDANFARSRDEALVRAA